MDCLEAASRYLMYRRVSLPTPKNYVDISNGDELLRYVKERISEVSALSGAKIGILLSGGMDSAILARFLPEGSIAYTFDYDEYEDLCEYSLANQYLQPGSIHKKVRIAKELFFDEARRLTIMKREPIVPHDPAISLACRLAKEDGVTHLITGVGADGRLGGFSHFYNNANFYDFVKTLHKQFVRPGKVLKSPVDVLDLLRRYTNNGIVDVQRYLREVGTEGTAVADTIRANDLLPINIFTDLTCSVNFSSSNLLNKRIIKSAFDKAYPNVDINKKRALPVPYGNWLASYKPSHPYIKTNSITGLGGKNKMQVHAVELFLQECS